jgi:hypothetical protein
VISVLLAVLVVCVVFWAASSLLAAFTVPDPIRTVVLVLVVLVALVWLVGAFGAPLPNGWLR